MKSTINSRQTGIVLFLLTFCLKLLFLPSIMSQSSKYGSLLTLLLYFLFDLFFLLTVIKYLKNKKSIKNYIKDKKIAHFLYKIIYLIFILIFFIKFVALSNEYYTYFKESIFFSAKLYLFLIIFLTCCVLIALENFRALCRTCELFFPVILIGLVVCIGIGFASPSFQTPFINFHGEYSGIFKSFLINFAWFGDPLYLLAFSQDIQVDKNFKQNLVKYYLLAYLIIFLIYFIFFGLYPNLAPALKYALLQIVVFTPRSTLVGRLDIIPTTILMFASFLQGALYLKFIFSSCKKISNHAHKTIVYSIVCFLLVICLYFVFVDLESIFTFAQQFLSYFVFAFSLLISALIVIYTAFKSKRREDKNEEHISND